jgi:hypothetical protein
VVDDFLARTSLLFAPDVEAVKMLKAEGKGASAKAIGASRASAYRVLNA